MKKSIFLCVCMFMLNTMSAQTYTIISRNNQDTIKMYPNNLGKAIKSIIPGSNDDGPNYLLIKKELDGKESLLFVELTKEEKKILTTYETDLATPGKWTTQVYTLLDVYKQMKRENAIYLKGKIIGIDVEMHQRPLNFQDLIIIDGIEFASPVKLTVVEESIIQNELQKAQVEEKQAQAEQKRAQAEQKRAQDEQKRAQCEMFDKQKQKKSNVDPTANEYYIAYLISTKQFDENKDKEVIYELCNTNIIQKLAETNDNFVLKIAAKGHDARLDIYAK